MTCKTAIFNKHNTFDKYYFSLKDLAKKYLSKKPA